MRAEIGALLVRKGQKPWRTRTRLSGLLALLNHVRLAIKKSQRPKDEGVPCSNRLARGYCSQLRSKIAGVESEALPLLLRVGILELVAPAKVNQYTKQSARYRIAPDWQRVKFEATDHQTNACTRKKLSNASERLEMGMNRHWQFRAQLLRDLSRITISESGEAEVDKLKLGTARSSSLAVVAAIATREHTAKVKGSGLIVTSLISCPRSLKPHLLIDGEPVALCDISSAHWMFLPRLVSDRIAYMVKRGDHPASMKSLRAEMSRLIELCSSGRFYESTLPEGATPETIKARKNLLNILMNSPKAIAARNVVWSHLRRRFPHCISIIDAIKRDDHRNISKPLHHFTANAITAALLDMQAQGCPAVPDTDCLIVRQRDHAAACRAIGEAVFAESRGVHATVGGIRYQTRETACDAPEHDPVRPINCPIVVRLASQ